MVPNPALQRFATPLGEWETAGTHPMVPGTPFHGRTSFAWSEGGAFITMHSEINEPDVPSGVAIIASDDAAQIYFLNYFDERGVSRKYDLTMENNLMTWRRDDPKFAQTMSFTPDEEGA